MLPELAGWDNFYVIVGSASGALIGLQFVVMALIAEKPTVHAVAAGAAFASPTIVHFGIALFLALLLHAPWRTITIAAAFACATGLGGAIYTVLVARRMRQQGAYAPGFEDWMFHVVLPLAAYACLALASASMPFCANEALFGVGAAVLLLLFIGIHNAWDNITYHVLVSSVGATRRPSRNSTESEESINGN
jgi:hypothetical protein